MLLLRGKYDNIIIPYLPYSGVYEDESKILELYKVLNFFGVGTKTKQKLTKQWCTFIRQHWVFYRPTACLKGCWV